MTGQEIFILLSIKTRIETAMLAISKAQAGKFLSYYPLKQGLKHEYNRAKQGRSTKFLSYYPLKQGLKLSPS